MFGITRGTATLLGVAVAGFLLWLATQFDVDRNEGYWAAVGVAAAAGLTMALSQLFGGWTKWGWPRLTAGVFLLGFLPALVVGGLVLLAAQPDSGTFGAGWAADVGLEDIARDLDVAVLAIAFGIGLTFGFTFDTTGPSRRPADDEITAWRASEPMPSHVAADADEATLAERRTVAVREGTVDRDGDGVDNREEEYAGAAPTREQPRRGPVRR